MDCHTERFRRKQYSLNENVTYLYYKGLEILIGKLGNHLPCYFYMSSILLSVKYFYDVPILFKRTTHCSNIFIVSYKMDYYIKYFFTVALCI